jgi:galactonate dehydratase
MGLMAARIEITAVTPIAIGQFLFVRIETDAGIVGLGESGVWGHLEASSTAIESFARYLVGEDAGRIEHHWNVMHRFSHFQGAAINGAIAAIDIALWDIKGKALGVPVYSLLGGPCRDRARVYGHAYGKTADELVENCVALKEAGFNAVGHINPFLDEREDETFFASHAEHMKRAVETVRQVREGLGDGVDMLLELHRRLTPAEAIDFIPRIEQYLPFWCEDPIRPENADAMAQVAHRVHAPIATGERYVSLHDFRALFSRDGAQFARVDVALCGGITGAKKVAALAEAHHVMVAPHNPLSPLGLAACLHVAAAIPNFAIQEYTTGFEALKMETSLRLLGSDVVLGVPPMKDGFVENSTEPGLGVTLAPDAAEGRPPIHRPVTMRRHRDGFVVDQ